MVSRMWIRHLFCVNFLMSKILNFCSLIRRLSSWFPFWGLLVYKSIAVFCSFVLILYHTTIDRFHLSILKFVMGARASYYLQTAQLTLFPVWML